MKVGDLVMCYRHPPGGVQFPIPSSEGLIVGFGKKGEGGKQDGENGKPSSEQETWA